MDQPAAAGDGPAKRIGRDVPASPAAAAAGAGCFDCNICLDCAAEPVVTLCGHLYCWPCIYEWLRTDADADAGPGTGSSTRRQCPVCKVALSPDALVPLYGRGAKKSPRGPASIPRRPAVQQGAQGGSGGGPRDRDGAPPQQARHQVSAAVHAQHDALFPPPFGARGSMVHPTAGGMLGGMAVAVLPWALLGQAQPPSMYYASPYHLTNPWQRRRHVELQRSLHQIWFFLLVFVLLCLLLF